MRGLVGPLAQPEIIMGAASALVLFVGSLLSQAAQTAPASLDPWVGVVTQFGGLGLAIYLVIHHTTRTIPDMQRDHPTERQELVAAFNARCDKQEACFREALEKIVSGTQKGH